VPGRWRIASPFDGWTLIDPGEATDRESAAAFPRGAALSAIDRLLALGPSGGAAGLRSAAGWLEPGLVGSPGAGLIDYKRIISRAVAAGELLLVRQQLRVVAASPQEPPQPGSDTDAAPPADVGWVEVTVADDEGQPYTGAYRVELPDGRVVSGRLNMGGVLRFDGIPPGSCQVTFPDLDQSSVEQG
jgi:hypothetical protein